MIQAYGNSFFKPMNIELGCFDAAFEEGSLEQPSNQPQIKNIQQIHNQKEENISIIQKEVIKTQKEKQKEKGYIQWNITQP